MDDTSTVGSAPNSIYFKDFLEGLPSLVWTCAADGPCDYLGPQWVSYTGIPEAEQLGYRWLEQLHPDDREITVERWGASAGAGKAFETEFRIRRHDGEHRWFKTRAIPLRDGDGNIKKWLGINTDVHDERVAQEALADLNAELEERVRRRTRELEELNNQLETTAFLMAEAQRVAQLGSWTMWTSDMSVRWSEELFRILGLDPAQKEVAYEMQPKMFTPESWERIERSVERAIQHGESYALKVDFFRPDGEQRRGFAQGEAIRNDDGEVVQLVGTFQDTTELFNLRAELDREAERARLATQAAGMGVWEWMIDSDQLTGDRVLAELASLPEPTDMVRSFGEWTQRIHPDDVARFEADLAQVAAGDDADMDIDCRVVHDGEVRHLQTAARLYHDLTGAPQRMFGVTWDVTEEVELRAALDANERLLRMFVQHAPAAIAMLDTDLRYLQASDRWLRDFDLSSDIIGRRHTEVLPDLPDRWLAHYERVLQGAVASEDEDRFVHSDGTPEWVQWEAHPWHLADGTIGGILLFTLFVTERKRLEMLARSQQEELRRSNQDLERFAYSASHDLQEPLRAVSGCAQLLARKYEGQLDPTADELIHHVVDGAERMRALIDGILQYSRVGKTTAASGAIPSEEAVAGALRNLREQVHATQAEISAGELPHVEIDLGQLTQVFQNVIGNALRYRSDATPSVTITAVERDDAWEFCVADNGIGIEPEYRDRIFQMFQRLHTRDEYPGTGIGLALCRKIVERAGGKMWVESTPAVGSKFFFTIARSPNER